MLDINKLLNELTLEEKASLLSGLHFWTTKPIENKGIPAVTMTDGPHGLRKEFGIEEGKGGVNIMKGSEPATCFPPAVTLASSWDTELIKEVGGAIADEAGALKVSTVLGPGTNIKRSPLCGRNFEYFSEDPYLAGEMATNYVLGVQEKGIGTSLKHYLANNEEFCRMSIDSRVDERALREIYLPAFESTVKRAAPQQVMASYNKLNGEYVVESRRALTEILREEWGYQGLVVSDWGAVNDRVKGVLAGLDLQMPGTKGTHDKQIVKAVERGDLSIEDLDVAVERVLRYVDECSEKKKKAFCRDFDKNHELCRKAGTKGAVLLKNEGEVLPLSEDESIALIGALCEESRYQGAGSSRICCQKLVKVLDAFKESGLSYDYEKGYTLKGDGYNKKLIARAVELAKQREKVVVVIGLTDEYESEGFDRKHMRLPDGHNILIEELAKVNSNIIVVLEGGAPMELPWRNNPSVKGILNTYLLGEAVGEATIDLLYGRANPSGKLAETFPKSLDDVLSNKYFPMGPRTVEYRESIYVGYRYFTTANKEVAYPFGYGLSYTQFEYSDLEVEDRYNEGDELKVGFTITNVGKYDGEEVAQIYVRHNNSPIFKPERELKGFKKVFIKSGESVMVEIILDSRSFAFYNRAIKGWNVLNGDYSIMIGSSSADIALCKNIQVVSLLPTAPLPENLPAVYSKLFEVEEIPQEAFELLYDEKLPENLPYKKGEFHINSTIGELSVTGLGNFILKVAKFVAKLIGGDAANRAMIVNTVEMMPIRSICNFTGGMFSMYSAYGLVDVFNGVKGGWRKFFRGFRKKYKDLM